MHDRQQSTQDNPGQAAAEQFFRDLEAQFDGCEPPDQWQETHNKKEKDHDDKP